MSYSSENVLALGTRVADVRDLVKFLGFKPWHRALLSDEVGRIEQFYWHDEVDYRSWGGIELSVYKDRENLVIVETRSTVGRSYFDLQHQNLTISNLRKRFRGTFRTDEGKGRYMKVEGEPPPAPASGCFLAFSRFGGNLIKAGVYLQSRAFPNHPADIHKNDPIPDYNPRIVANNTLVPFLVAASEDYFKSTWVAITRYSANKEAIFKSYRLQGNQLLAVANCTPDTLHSQVSDARPGNAKLAQIQAVRVSSCRRVPPKRRGGAWFRFRLHRVCWPAAACQP